MAGVYVRKAEGGTQTHNPRFTKKNSASKNQLTSRLFKVWRSADDGVEIVDDAVEGTGSLEERHVAAVRKFPVPGTRDRTGEGAYGRGWRVTVFRAGYAQARDAHPCHHVGRGRARERH